MSVNNYKLHLMVLPEDDANLDIANGFTLDSSFRMSTRSIQVLPPSGGWLKVLDDFTRNQLPIMKSNRNRHVLLIIDFDNDVKNRFEQIKGNIPQDVKDRVYVLGSKSEPEVLKTSLSMTYTKIGEMIYNQCPNLPKENLWSHPLLEHNQAELQRLINNTSSFLFK